MRKNTDLQASEKTQNIDLQANNDEVTVAAGRRNMEAVHNGTRRAGGKRLASAAVCHVSLMRLKTKLLKKQSHDC
jgi:hypothetical protein